MHPQPGLGAKSLTVDVTGPLRDFVGQGKAVPDGMVVGSASLQLDHYFGPPRERLFKTGFNVSTSLSDER